MSSSVRAWVVTAVGAAAVLGATVAIRAQNQAPAQAEAAAPAEAAAAPQEAPPGDPARGELLAYTCFGCHGIADYKNAYPIYNVPKLTGQHPQYLYSALKAYQSGERGHATMHAQASTMSDQDMRDVAAYLAGRPLPADAKPVGQPPKQAELCVSCHGTNGVGITPDYPTLAGQHADYLVRTLHDYKRGGRKNAIMVGFAQQLSDADAVVISEYYARQRPPLATLEKSFTALGGRH